MASGAYLVGYRFHPTDLELVTYYLHNWAAMVDQFRSSPIFDFPDFYGQNEPWLIWDMFRAQSNSTMKEEEEEPLYFFTHRKKLNSKAKKFDRKVGSGTWSAQYSKNVVAADDDSVIGIKREFRYEGGSNPHQNGAWLMQEYQITSHSNDLVLCTLRKNPRKLPPPTCPAPLNQSHNIISNKRKMNEEAINTKSFKRKKMEPPKQKEQLMLPFDQPLFTTDDQLQTVQVDGTNISIADCPNDTSYAYFDSEVEEFFGLTTDDIYDDDDCQFSSSEIQAFLACLD